MTGASIIPRRAPRKADLDRVLKVAKGAGLKVSAIEIGADGGFRLLTGDGPEPQRDELQEWRARRDAGKATRA